MPKSCTGRYAKASILTAAANAAMTTVPKLLTSPCTARMPRFMTDCWMQVSAEKDAISFMRAGRSLARQAARSSGNPNQVYSAMPTPETYCAMTVASAAPATPRPSPQTNQRSSTMFSPADTARNTSGTTELPSARSSDAK